MNDEPKVMVTVRLPPDVLDRVDFIARNTDKETIAHRSDAIRVAIEEWLPKEEKHLMGLGIAVSQKTT